MNPPEAIGFQARRIEAGAVYAVAPLNANYPVRGEFQISPAFGGLRAAIPFFMCNLIVLIVHPITTVFRLVQPGGVRAVVAESVLTKHQL